MRTKYCQKDDVHRRRWIHRKEAAEEFIDELRVKGVESDMM